MRQVDLNDLYCSKLIYENSRHEIAFTRTKKNSFFYLCPLELMTQTPDFYLGRLYRVIRVLHHYTIVIGGLLLPLTSPASVLIYHVFTFD